MRIFVAQFCTLIVVGWLVGEANNWTLVDYELSFCFVSVSPL